MSLRDELGRALAGFAKAGDPRGRADAETEIWRRHGREAAIFVLDLAGFTRGVAAEGLIAYLARVHDLLCLTDPIIVAHGGETVKHEADNCFAAFPSAVGAVAAAEECLVRLADSGAMASVGIASGPVLFIGDDFYGMAVNVASKLGEDIAGPGEILIDETAAAMLSDGARIAWAPRRVEASGLEFAALARLMVTPRS